MAGRIASDLPRPSNQQNASWKGHYFVYAKQKGLRIWGYPHPELWLCKKGLSQLPKKISTNIWTHCCGIAWILSGGLPHLWIGAVHVRTFYQQQKVFCTAISAHAKRTTTVFKGPDDRLFTHAENMMRHLNSELTGCWCTAESTVEVQALVILNLVATFLKPTSDYISWLLDTVTMPGDRWDHKLALVAASTMFLDNLAKCINLLSFLKEALGFILGKRSFQPVLHQFRW